jgi:Tfp pilus assembly PilM family ATPase
MRNRLRGLLGRRKATSVIALDVAPTEARAVRARRDGSAVVMDGFRVSRVEGARTLEDACREAVSLRIDREPVAISVRSPDAAIRQVELPPMTPDELREALPWEAKRHVGGLGDDAVVDAQVLDSAPGGPMNVLLVAFPRREFEELAALWESLGIDPEFVDLAPLAVMNAALGTGDGGPQAILELGSRTGSFSIFSSSGVVLFRDLSARVSRLDSLLGSALGIADPQLDGYKRTGKLAGAPPPAKAALEKALAEVVADLGEDLRAGRLYLENRTGGALDRVWIAGSTGGFLHRSGLVEAIGTAGGASLERLDPFHGFRVVGVDELGLERQSFELAAAAGVAARYLTSSS